MPHITLQVSPLGLILDVAIGVSEERAKALTAANQTIPTFLPVRAMIDTGASCTCIDPSVLKKLELSPTGVVSVHTPSTDNSAVEKNQYDVSLSLVQAMLPAVRTFTTVPVVEAELEIQGIQALIGRDILRACLLIYDGQTGIFTLSF